jgi:TonB family protein
MRCVKNLLRFALCSLTTPVFLLAQSNTPTLGTSAPVKWERYRAKDHNISILFPKMPTAWSSPIGCSEVYSESYRAFAEGVVYSLTIYSRKQNEYPCTRIMQFDRKLLLDHLAKIHGTKADDPNVVAAAQDGQKTNFKDDVVSIWVLPQMSKDRWIELTIDHRKDAKTNEKEFVESLDLKSNQGRSIGDGAEATIGDSDTGAADASAADSTSKPPGDPLIVLSRPRAKYTDSARSSGIQGVVRLRIELLRNGSLGNIEVVKGLKYGLTEQAVAAAKKIVFLPRRVNGVRVNSTVTFEYSFSIY